MSEQATETRTIATLPADAQYSVSVRTGRHHLRTDEPHSDHSATDGPTPVAMCLSALASCTAATMRMYAERKGLDLGDISVEVDFTGPDEPLRRRIRFTQSLDPQVQERLTEIAAKTPVTLLIRQPHEVTTTVEGDTHPAGS